MRYLAFILLSACVDVVPLPVDGQVYECTLIDKVDGHSHGVVERCWSWGDWQGVAREIYLEHGETFDVDCRGTRKACDWEGK